MKTWKELRCNLPNDKASEELKELTAELKSFDWHYAMSDSREVHQAGSLRRGQLWAKARALGQPGEDLFNQYARATWNQ